MCIPLQVKSLNPYYLSLLDGNSGNNGNSGLKVLK